jgi:hypothetical protein
MNPVHTTSSFFHTFLTQYQMEDGMPEFWYCWVLQFDHWMFSIDMVLIWNCTTIIQLVCIIMSKHHTMKSGRRGLRTLLTWTQSQSGHCSLGEKFHCCEELNLVQSMASHLTEWAILHRCRNKGAPSKHWCILCVCVMLIGHLVPRVKNCKMCLVGAPCFSPFICLSECTNWRTFRISFLWNLIKMCPYIQILVHSGQQ